ncbi:FCS-Like Zinc finger 8-like [Mangifera indica]|uniref:FCS-Like Zinc finger 8-like n=1 Tax=Mangifera indica TaxID=29780 RepID=UPI001CFB7976|nr:FCS-Like Zinc finger 8-like [Mangifera indica]
MLRNRSRAVTNKQSLMENHQSFQSPSNSQNNKRPISFLFSPRFRAFKTKCLAESEAVISPSSIIDTKPFSPFGNIFSDDILKSPKLLADQKKKYSRENLDSQPIGLGLIDVLTDNKPIEENFPLKPNHKKVFFGNNLRVQVPPLPVSNLSPSPSPKSPGEIGIKSSDEKSTVKTKDISPGIYTQYTSVTAMELSEDYTCVISRGANPKTTHIFDNCVIESYSLSEKSNFPLEKNNNNNNNNNNFLSFCHTCKKNLEQKNDIYIYRGEKAFCSQECRYQEILLDELEN